MGKCHFVYSEGRHKLEDISNYEFTRRRSSRTGKIMLETPPTEGRVASEFQRYRSEEIGRGVRLRWMYLLAGCDNAKETIRHINTFRICTSEVLLVPLCCSIKH
jgi:hypothetical protein